MHAFFLNSESKNNTKKFQTKYNYGFFDLELELELALPPEWSQSQASDLPQNHRQLHHFIHRFAHEESQYGFAHEESHYGFAFNRTDGYSSLDLESGRRWEEEGNPLTQEEQMSFLKKPVNCINDAISKTKFLALSMPSESASFESSPNFIRDTKIQMANLSVIEEDKDNFEANAPSPFLETKSSTPLLPETEINHEAHHIRNDSSQKDSTEEENIDDTHPIHGSPTDSEYFSCTDVDQRTNISKKVILKWFLVFANLASEVTTAVCDQLSSSDKSHFALIATVTSFLTLGFCIIEISCKYRQGKYVWRMKGKFYWFYNAGDGKPFGSVLGIIGLVSGTIQFILTAVAYGMYYSRHVNSPIRLHVCSIVIAIVNSPIILKNNC